MERIVTCYDLTPQQLDQVRSAAGDWPVAAVSQSELANAAFDATILCGHVKTSLPWERLVSAGRLKWIQSTAAGLDHCLVPEVVTSPIVVSGSSGLYARQVAEQTLALLLSLTRSMQRFHGAQQRRVYERLPTDDLRGRTVAVLGFGGNGQWIAWVLQRLVGRIIATDCFPQEAKGMVPDVEVFSAADTQAVVGQADIVIAVLPLLPQTWHLVDAELFRRMRPGSYFINVGRGATVDEVAMIAAVESGHLRGVGIDVAEFEPLDSRSPLWDIPNVIITPHVGAQARDRFEVATYLFCENLRRFRRGEPLINLVDKQLGFPRPQHRWNVFSSP